MYAVNHYFTACIAPDRVSNVEDAEHDQLEPAQLLLISMEEVEFRLEHDSWEEA